MDASRSIVASLLALVLCSCGSATSRNGFVDDDAGTTSDDASTSGDGNGGGDDSSLIRDGEAGGPCVNLGCKQVDCASQGKADTTISGTVYDPAGKLGLYNVFVYVPNATPDPIVPGNVKCEQCQAPASGSPLVFASTDATGKFVIKNAPAGDGIPLVMQVGKWRRQITIGHIEACTDNPQTDKNQMRLPGKASEGDMPLIAYTSGCDYAECFLRKVGIADSEFVPPGGNGHVHFYTGQQRAGYVTATINGGNTAQQTYTWWTDSKNLLQYDILFNACECLGFNRNQFASDAYQSVHDYLDGGGRVFATHYYYNWFAPPTGKVDFQAVAQWSPGSAFSAPGFFIDTTFPKGKSFADWLQANGTTSTYGQIVLVETRPDVLAVSAGATRWIYNAASVNDPNYASSYLSLNTPVTAPVQNQCGRAVFSDVHLSGGLTIPGPFPNECNAIANDHGTNERALEFLFFDLSSCVQDDSKPPPQPPPK
jgi:hypothetical protein